MLHATSGENLYHVLTRAGVEFNAPCAGRCFCGKCLVMVQGEVSQPSAAEMDLLSPALRAQGMRLACGVTLLGDATVALYESGAATILSASAGEEGEVNPAIHRIMVDTPMPTLTDPRSDLARVMQSLGEEGKHLHMQLPVMAKISEALRIGKGHFIMTALDDEVLDAFNEERPLYGVAVDIGTTTLVCYLMNLATGEQIDIESALNPQRTYGADVISRSDYAMAQEDGLARVQQVLVREIQRMILAMAARQAIDPNTVYHIVCVGNTVMLHLFLGLPSTHIAVSPFVPIVTDLTTVRARDVGFELNAQITIAPCVAGYVGGDTVAAILASGMEQRKGLSLLIDIGTNGEMALGDMNGILTCSTAAGPAFEGAHIQKGMGGVAGAISKVWLEGDDLCFETIGGQAPIGICGSGLVDAVRVMKEAGVIDEMGRIEQDGLSQGMQERLLTVDSKPAFQIAGEIYICQKDLREVQLAKGAIAAGIEILMDEMGVNFSQIDALYLAGGFGSYIDYDSACAIGLLPQELRGKIKPIGNGAGAGAKRMLLSRTDLETAGALARQMRYIELSSRPDFQDLFVDHMMF